MKNLDISKIKKVYDILEDSKSEYIFENRLLFSLTHDYKYIRNVACTVDVVDEIYKELKSTSESIGIFGAGDVGRHLVKTYDDIAFKCFIDNKKAGTVYEGIPVISLRDFMNKYPEAYIVISTKLYYEDIYSQLIESGISSEKIINLGKHYAELNHKQYFDLPQLKEKMLSKEIFVDGGSYDGNSAIDFSNWLLAPEAGYVYAWEPDYTNIEKCKKLFEKSNLKYELIPKGLWNVSDILKFRLEGTASSISKEGDVEVEVDCIDNVISSEVTFIKMDIEGAEYNALLGASNTIKKYKPKLAICVYHKPEDIWEIPLLIHELNPEYQLYLRHYSFADNETVLYAI